jgi:hypothetical protein
MYVGFEILTVVAVKSTICLPTGFMLTSFFDPEDGGDMFLRNVS